jgi:acetyltransferase
VSIRHLDRLLEPKSVVVGASDRVGSVGATVWRNLRAGSFAGPIYAVNPKHAAIEGSAVFAHPAELPQAPDLAVLCTPPDTVAELFAHQRDGVLKVAITP